MDGFLDSHPDIAGQLKKDPSLVDNKQYVADHPALRDFLADHSELREAFDKNPNLFMQDENRFGRREDQIQRSEVVTMDNFLDSHPEIAEQLKKNPSLVNNKQFLDGHPALRDFLADHSNLREAFSDHPDAFMHAENRFDRREDRIDRSELATMDGFLDKHPEIAEQLRKNPSLANNKDFEKDHPALRDFMQDHPEVREAYADHPNAFMADENRFDRRTEAGAVRTGDHDVTRGELSNFHSFLESHGTIANELSKHPELATNQEFLENHPELQTYLKANPQVSEELRENPQTFVKSAQTLEAQKTAPKLPAEPKNK